MKRGDRIRIKQDWGEAGQCGTVMGEVVFAEQNWVPVLWDNQEDPDFHKEAGLELIPDMTEAQFNTWIAHVVSVAKKPAGPLVASDNVVKLWRNALYPNGIGPSWTPMTMAEYKTWKQTGDWPDWDPLKTHK